MFPGSTFFFSNVGISFRKSLSNPPSMSEFLFIEIGLILIAPECTSIHLVPVECVL